MFEAFYKRDLSRRLLSGKVNSDDMERAVLRRLTAECGAQYTARLEGMFRDLELSADLNKRFRVSHAPHSHLDRTLRRRRSSSTCACL